jgi:hypothetical protein
VFQVQGAHQRVLIAEAARAGQPQVGDLGAHPAARQVRQHRRVALAGDQRLDHVPGRQGGQRRGHRVNLDPAVLEDLGQALQLTGALLDELLAVAGQLADRGDLRRWDETAA